ncbi:MAG TPA: hypothetical protein VLA90_03935 [Actinomycetota bacterium]|nr:hypothetical protein [Actinomycetota bacterium]
MTNRRTTRSTKRAAASRRSAWSARSTATLVLGVVGIVAAVAIALVAAEPWGAGGDDVALARTGEVNEMGLPVVTTPGTTSGSAAAGGVEVRGAVWEMGPVPLNVAVRPFWTLVNTSGSAVSIGEPHPEVRAGCCPGPFTIGSRELAAGQSTTLTFELAMHPGMDGWHDIAVHVPVVSDEGGEDVLALAVTGDFRGALAG